jgi:hypothetical protein
LATLSCDDWRILNLVGTRQRADGCKTNLAGCLTTLLLEWMWVIRMDADCRYWRAFPLPTAETLLPSLERWVGRWHTSHRRCQKFGLQ